MGHGVYISKYTISARWTCTRTTCSTTTDQTRHTAKRFGRSCRQERDLSGSKWQYLSSKQTNTDIAGEIHGCASEIIIDSGWPVPIHPGCFSIAMSVYCFPGDNPAICGCKMLQYSIVNSTTADCPNHVSITYNLGPRSCKLVDRQLQVS